MSSAGSASSRLSQFGLYRAIDARTEHFLNLSKKRQIKQGCVCAAVSTAVTVIVVITIILIYEYNVVAEAKRSTLPQWIDLMNNSAHDSVTLEKFDRANINIDRTTLKLLPILLKALSTRTNRYIDKMVTESTSSSPFYETSDTTDITYTKNIFADTRNWMKMPSSRLYAIEYKTSPMVYFKNPTRNIDYFTKVRKIRDYQRILRYVDRMINEKNFGPTQPMNSFTEKPIQIATHKTKLKTSRNKKVTLAAKSTPSKLKTSTPKILTTETIVNCPCPHKLGEHMQKLLASIQILLRHISGSKLKENDNLGKENNNNCNIVKEIQPYPIQSMQYTTDKTTSGKTSSENYDNSLAERTTTEHHDKSPTERTITESNDKYTTERSTSENGDNSELEATTSIPFKTFLNKHKYTVDYANTFDVRRDHIINTILNLIKSNYNKNKQVYSNFYSNEEPRITNSYVMPSQINVFTNGTTTELYEKGIAHRKADVNETEIATDRANSIFPKKIHISSDISSTLSSFLDSNFANDDVDDTESANLLNYFQKLDTHSLELVKSKIISRKKHNSEEDKSVVLPIKGTTSKNEMHNNPSQMRKLGNLATNYGNRPESLKMPYRFAPISKATTSKSILVTDTKHFITTNKRIDKRNNEMPSFNLSTPVQKFTTTRMISSTKYGKHLTSTNKIKNSSDNHLEKLQSSFTSKAISEHSTTKTISSTNYLKPLPIESTTEKNLMLKNETNLPKVNTTKTVEGEEKKHNQDQFKDIVFEETESVWEESISQETLKQIEEAIKKLNNVDVDALPTVTDDQYQLELLKLEHKTISPRSMIPNSRPMYLQMQRNDWRQDNIHDYDNNFTYD